MEKVLYINGSVMVVLEGKVAFENMYSFEPSSFHFALGSSAQSDPALLGETIVIQGKRYVSWVEEEKFHTLSSPTLKSPFLMGISQQKPAKIWQNKSPMTLGDLYQTLARTEKMGFALLAFGRFVEFHSTHIKKAPIYHENINENSDMYWSDLPVTKERMVCLFGVVIGSSGKEKFPKETLDRAFYQNPAEGEASDLLSHTHAALIKEGAPTVELDRLNQLPVEVVHHALTESILGDVTLALFPISKIRTVS